MSKTLKLSETMIDALRFLLGDHTPGRMFNARTLDALKSRGLIAWVNGELAVLQDRMTEVVAAIQAVYPVWTLPQAEEAPKAQEPAQLEAKDQAAARHPEFCPCDVCHSATCGVQHHGLTCARIGKRHKSEAYDFKRLHQTKEGVYFDAEGPIRPMAWPISHRDWFRAFGTEHPDLRDRSKAPSAPGPAQHVDAANHPAQGFYQSQFVDATPSQILADKLEAQEAIQAVYPGWALRPKGGSLLDKIQIMSRADIITLGPGGVPSVRRVEYGIPPVLDPDVTPVPDSSTQPYGPPEGKTPDLDWTGDPL